MSNARNAPQFFTRLRGFFLFPIFLLFFSCAVFAPSNFGRNYSAIFQHVEDVRPEWQYFEEGIDFFHGRTSTPALEFWALRVDLGNPYLQIVVKGGAGEGRNTLSTRVSSFVRDNGLIAGINATPFDVSSTREGQPIRNSGIVISGGELISYAVPRYDALVFFKDGTAAIVSQSKLSPAGNNEKIKNIENALGAFHHILVDGVPAQRTFIQERRFARSAAGISAPAAYGQILYLLVIDGRRSGSIGATEMETALLLRALGSWNGVNLDGGGSSALALRRNDGSVRVVNNPAHGGIPGTERAVAGSLGITR